ncbi:helix-turn-helix transcriptional regulator [Seonamhaeicola marinus]|uniref:Helix-turn-helix transcriptional regulator n=2 Tax=Seonamhaeicola marinus TaxID=1912246 RepID=A0A5D0J1H4_9FLAO|nr:helix-turn-helix transcriptional regulator [Seonamhaeicola marinus]
MKYLLYLSNTDKSKNSSQMKQYFGEYIRQLRTKSELTLTQLGAKLDLDSANLSKIENGKREFDEKRLELLASVFDLDIENLKTEFFSELFAKKIYETNCSTEVLKVAEEKVKYYREQNVKQGRLKL